MSGLNKWVMLPLLLGVLFLQGCTGLPVHMGVKQDVDLSQYDMDNPRPVTMSASGFQLLLFIPISVNSRQERAYAAIERMAGDGLVGDVKIKESWTYAFVGTVYKTTIEANIYPKKL